MKISETTITYQPGECPSFRCPRRDEEHTHPRYNNLGWDLSSPYWHIPLHDTRTTRDIDIAEGMEIG